MKITVDIHCGDSCEKLKLLPETDKTRDTLKVGSGFGKNISNWVNRDKAYPTNVPHRATECNNQNHSAAFPSALPEWFIKLFTEENDTVLDPFMGSGTALLVAKQMRRHSTGIDIVSEYCERVRGKINSVEMRLRDDLPIRFAKAAEQSTGAKGLA